MQVVIDKFSGNINSGRDFSEVLSYINSTRRDALRAIGVSYSAQHIFDAEKSVIWNRQMVIERNNAKAVARSIVNRSYNEMRRALTCYVHKYCENFLDQKSLEFGCVEEILTGLEEMFGDDWPKMLDINLNIIKTFLRYQ